MSAEGLLSKATGKLSPPVRLEQARDRLADFRAALPDGLDATAEAALASPEAEALLLAIFGASPYLSGLIRRDPARFAGFLVEEPGAALDRVLAETQRAAGADTIEALMHDLRVARGASSLLIALADILGVWSLEEVTGALSAFADICIETALLWLLRDAAKRGDLKVDPDAVNPAASGLVVLGMGKYGARELNYSSDIDLVVFYEPETLSVDERLSEREVFVKIVQKLVRVLQERTEDGYVFRTDLRLRPDPGGTALAVSLPAAEHYYESRGQNWERAAFIKARPVAADKEAGARFLKLIGPFIWRRHLDFASIEDIHSMKRQIHAVGGHGQIAIAGHDIKLGRGGIREIEFFVQTQQLIAGGRDTDLRGPQTVPMLHVLADRNWIEPMTADELAEAYRRLRRLEHRLQMIDDAQTHQVPSDPGKLAEIAAFMGFDSVDAFADDLRATLKCVQGHYSALFETAPPLSEEAGNLVFTGTDDDPETIRTLEELGFKRASDLSAAVRHWHSGAFPATRSSRSRERLTALMPTILRALAATADPDTAFRRFDQFLQGLPAGVQLFSMFYSNPHLLGLLAAICGTAPRLADYLSRNPRVMEAVLEADFFHTLPGDDQLAESLDQALDPAQTFEDVLDFARIWAREHRFRVGVRVLSGSATAREAGPAYTSIAETLVRALAERCELQVQQRAGSMPGGAWVVLAMGKLGSCELSASSDLDLITVYDVEDPAAESDGAKALAPPQYYTKVCQQLLTALTAPTSEGMLYEVDLRLRPSGNAGPLATRLSSFTDYQANHAWTWEHMALTRARAISGPPSLVRKVNEVIREVLTRPRDPVELAEDVRSMRERIEKEFGTKDRWELKQVRGGLIDLEFIAQFLQLRHAAETPYILSTRTREVFKRAGEMGLIGHWHADRLIEAFDLYHNLTQVLRVCVEETPTAETITKGLKALLIRAANAPDFTVLERELDDKQALVLRFFDMLIVP